MNNQQHGAAAQCGASDLRKDRLREVRWHHYPEHGCYYAVIDNSLCYVDMAADGTLVWEEMGEVAFGLIDEELEVVARRIVKEILAAESAQRCGECGTGFTDLPSEDAPHRTVGGCPVCDWGTLPYGPIQLMDEADRAVFLAERSY